jgi:hypothetical protein
LQAGILARAQKTERLGRKRVIEGVGQVAPYFPGAMAVKVNGSSADREPGAKKQNHKDRGNNSPCPPWKQPTLFVYA